VFVATGEFDLLLGDVHSLKGKRALIRPVLAELRRFDVAAAEVGDADLHRRARVGVAAVGNEPAHVRDLVQRCEDLLAARPELALLSARVRLFDPGEDFAP
jgi:uncharacterized protein YlxP (DUF503 family)